MKVTECLVLRIGKDTYYLDLSESSKAYSGLNLLIKQFTRYVSHCSLLRESLWWALCIGGGGFASLAIGHVSASVACIFVFAPAFYVTGMWWLCQRRQREATKALRLFESQGGRVVCIEPRLDES